MRIPLPASLRSRASFTGEPVPARPAATIALVRDGNAGLETFLMRRQASMAFAAGMHVFPGGGVQGDDADPVEWEGPSPEYFAERLGCDPALARGLVVAAVRETFEETGVLLAGIDEHSIVADTRDHHPAREALERHELSFGRFLEQNGLRLRADLIEPWAHWITPGFEPRRFDTRFFVAALPEGQRIDQVGTEADHYLWAPVAESLARVERGEVAMLPPTQTVCRELQTTSAGRVLETARERTIEPIEPRLVEIDGSLWLET